MFDNAREVLGAAGALLWSALWIFALGLIALWGFFLVMGAISLGDPLWMTVIVGGLAAGAAIHFVRIRRMLSDHAHDDVARHAHMLRERRGF